MVEETIRWLINEGQSMIVEAEADLERVRARIDLGKELIARAKHVRYLLTIRSAGQVGDGDGIPANHGLLRLVPEIALGGG